MRFTINNNLYKLVFSHHIKIPYLGEIREATFVEFYAVLNPSLSDKEITKYVGVGAAICNSIDTYSKKKGRKIALADFFKDSPNVDWTKDKKVRGDFWAQYFKQTNM